MAETVEDHLDKMEFLTDLALMGDGIIQATYGFDPEISTRVVSNLMTKTETTFRGDGAVIRLYASGRETKFDPSKGPGGKMFTSNEYRWHTPTLAEISWITSDFSD